MLLARKIFGTLAGMVVGGIAWILLWLSVGGGISLLPIADYLVQMFPGILIGGVCGFIFPGPFNKLLSWIIP